jgi:signal transduction histidine kinase
MMLGKRPAEVFPPENATVLEANYRAALNGETRSFEDSFQGRHYHDQMIPIRDAEGEVVAALSIAQNITRRVEDKAELERQNRRLDEFASAVSHDLRGPLSVAQGRLALVRMDCESDHLDPIARAHDRMDELIDSLLSLARQGQTVGETTVLDLETVVEECWATVQTDDCRLEVEGTCRIRADESRFRQLFENVVRNAVEHGTGAEATAPLTVRVGVLPDGFYVEDDGPGVENGRHDTIFERSVTTKAQGTGFGLAMVREIVDAHGWTSVATDSAEGGLRFEVTGVAPVE